MNIKIKCKIAITSLFFFPSIVFSEDFTVNAFVDSYVASSTNNISGEERGYFTQPVKNNQLSLNLASATFNYDNAKVRAKFVPQVGDSVSVNYNAEPGDTLKYLQEGYLGYYISDKTNVDVGVFLSHIGVESWLSKDNLTYTRSFIAEFSPYYEAGARLMHKFNDTLSGQFLVLNGWQNVTDERHPALGTQLAAQFDDVLVSSNVFLGDETGSTRYFHDGIISYKPTTSLTLAGSIDTGYQSDSAINNGFWWGYTLMSKYQMIEALAINARFEGYTDQNGIIVSTPDNNDFLVKGASIGLEYDIVERVKLRGEVKHLWSQNRVFRDDQSLRNNDTIFVLSVSFFDERKY